MWNRVEYRPLEGFVYAITPFNFTAIAGNLPTSAALMGNVVVWKPAATQVYSANLLMQIFKEAGLPNGVINMVMGDSGMITETLLASPDFAGVHFTGSTGVLMTFGQKIEPTSANTKPIQELLEKQVVKILLLRIRSNSKQVSTGIARGAFEYQVKCSAASRVYIPQSLWPAVKAELEADLKSMKMGSPEDMSNFITAVISEGSFDKLAKAIDQAKKDTDAEVIMGGNYDKSKGTLLNLQLS
jgi:1-pyrroline-5-carboxylate dehydrogenase